MISIRATANWLAAVIAVGLLGMGGLIYWSVAEFETAENSARIARHISRAVVSLIQLDDEDRINDRVTKQWTIAVEHIQAESASLLRYENLKHAALLLNKELANSRAIFDHQRTEKLNARQLGMLRDAMNSSLQSMLGISQHISDTSREIRTRKVVDIRDTIGSALLVLLGALLAASVMVQRLVVRPVHRLSASILAYRQGKPWSPGSGKRTRELEQISDAFSAVVGNLESTTVSKSLLEAEVAVRTKAEQEARDALHKLSEAQERMVQMEKLSAIGTLVGGVAHEINNPLMGLSSYVEYGIEHSPPGKTRDWLEKARHEVERIQRLVRDMLVFARIKPTQARDVCDARKVAAKALALLSADYRRLAIVLNVDINESASAVVCNEDSLQQTYLNLLINARDALATVEGPRLVNLCSAPEQDGWVRLDVTDNGPGIPDHVRKRVFDPFFTTKAPGAGTGLGLAVSRQMIEAAGGELVLRPSGEQRGVTFSIKLRVHNKEVPQ